MPRNSVPYVRVVALEPIARSAVKQETLGHGRRICRYDKEPEHRVLAFRIENQMSERTPPSRAVLRANKAFKAAQPELTEYEKTQKALLDNRERLKSERLAREAAAGDGSQGPSRDGSR